MDAINTGLIFGAVPNQNDILDLFRIYQRHGKNVVNNVFVQEIYVKITTDYFRTKGFKYRNKLQKIEDVSIYPTSFFCPQPYGKKIKHNLKSAYTIHHYDGSWIGKIKKYFHQINKNSLSYIILFGLGKLHLTYKIATLLHLEKVFGRKNNLQNMTEARMYLQQVSEKPHGYAISLKAISLEYEYDLSVIIPAYNVQDYLTDCLNSVVDQTSRYKFEIFIYLYKDKLT